MADVGASLTPMLFVLRFHAPGQGYGAPVHGTATVVRHGDTAEVVGLTVQGQYTAGHRRAVQACLAKAGFAWAVWDRIVDGRVRPVKRRV